MGYSSRSPKHRHRKGKSCPECIRQLEIECGLRPRFPNPPKGPAGGSRPRPTTMSPAVQEWR